MYCSRERRDISDSELRHDDKWGWVHDVPPAHTTSGTVLAAQGGPFTMPDGYVEDDGKDGA